ncbi:MAG: Holliday junction DNA helicase RuvA [Candidatus Omnitrophica bacterium]|nr:Holliday junction DNA helicase RuvA [Candidatus Omnitrophota bacterium]
MISRLRGVLCEQRDTSLLIDVHGVVYEVLMPPAILAAVGRSIGADGQVQLTTYHYHHVDMARSVPFLIGFADEIEKEFFEQFITVAGIGPKAALKAFTLPIPTIAAAIDAGDLVLLRSLPGIGEQRAKEIVAKLQGRVGKFALMPDRGGAVPVGSRQTGAGELADEAIAILLRLEYKKAEAKQMVEQALERNPQVKTPEELLNEVYRLRQPALTPPPADRPAGPVGVASADAPPFRRGAAGGGVKE